MIGVIVNVYFINLGVMPNINFSKIIKTCKIFLISIRF